MCAKQIEERAAAGGNDRPQWDGIEELNNPLPRWWVWMFYATIVWGIGYTIAYPAWPLITGATPGLLGASTRADVAAEIAAVRRCQRRDQGQAGRGRPDRHRCRPRPCWPMPNGRGGGVPHQLRAVPRLGRGGFEGKGYPNLLDDDWLWGGTMEDIHLTITHGIRNTTDADARYSEMPNFGADGFWTQRRSRRSWNMCWRSRGRSMTRRWRPQGPRSSPTTAPPAIGRRRSATATQGAPKLTDAIWLYGGSREAITDTVTNARFGVMPNWNERLSEDEIRAVAFYVHGRGGGE